MIEDLLIGIWLMLAGILFVLAVGLMSIREELRKMRRERQL